MPQDPQTDQHDFGRLFVQYQPRIYGYIRSLVADRNDAEDMLQETASVLWQKFDEFTPGTNFLAWAIQVARYQVMYFRQRQRRDVLRFSEAFIDAVAEETVAQSDQLSRMQDALAGCLEKLSPEDRELFCRRYKSDTTTKNIAEQLGRPASTVYNAIARIRRALAECVQRTLAKEDRA